MAINRLNNLFVTLYFNSKSAISMLLVNEKQFHNQPIYLYTQQADKSFKLNSRILKVTDTIVTKFLEDTIVEDEIELANTKHNFFSQHVWNDTMLRVLDKKITREEEEILSLKKLADNLF